MLQDYPMPTRWLMKNTDTFAGFGHCINSYLAGVALAERHGVGLIHRPQGMAHGRLGFIFTDFLDADQRHHPASLRADAAGEWQHNARQRPRDASLRSARGT